MGALEDLRERAIGAAAHLGHAIASGRRIRIHTHNDVDGVSAGTLLFLAVRNQGGSAHLSFSGHFYAEDLDRALGEGPEFLAFCDMASDLMPSLCEQKVPHLVLDHHPVDDDDPSLVNPHVFGLDGTKDASAAGVAYLVARALNPSNISLSPIALCGAFGDMQGLVGVNEGIAAEAESAGHIKRRTEIRLIGRVDRPVEYSLSYSTLPFVKGISGNAEGASRLLKENGIEVGARTSIEELDDEKERLLISSLVEHMVREDASTSEAEKLFGETLRFPTMLAPTIEDLVDFVESCASLGEFSTAAALLSGDSRCAEPAERCRLRYKEMIFEGVRAFDGAVRLEALDYLVLEGLAPLSGKLAGIFANAGFSGHDRPIFTLNPEERWIKVSARMNPQLVDRGLHLGKALDSVAARLGGSGGGHAVAAGARVPRQSMEDFVRELDKEVQLQLADEEA